MAIKNDMEFLVRAEVQRRRERSGKDATACWCSLCEMDMLALALNQLPPKYCHEKNFGGGGSKEFAEEVRDAVVRAIQKVSRRPKHRPGRPASDIDDLRLENFAQKIGFAVIASILTPEPSACACDQCKADMLAYALNHYPPKYGVSYGGRASYQANYEDFIRHEIGQALAQALAVVRAHPHH